MGEEGRPFHPFSSNKLGVEPGPLGIETVGITLRLNTDSWKNRLELSGTFKLG